MGAGAQLDWGGPQTIAASAEGSVQPQPQAELAFAWPVGELLNRELLGARLRRGL